MRVNVIISQVNENVLVIVDRKDSVKELKNQLESEIYELLKNKGLIKQRQKKTIRSIVLRRKGFVLKDQYILGQILRDDEVLEVSYELEDSD